MKGTTPAKEHVRTDRMEVLGILTTYAIISGVKYGIRTKLELDVHVVLGGIKSFAANTLIPPSSSSSICMVESIEMELVSHHSRRIPTLLEVDIT